MIVAANTVADPIAMVVHPQAAAVTVLAVLRPQRLGNHSRLPVSQ